MNIQYRYHPFTYFLDDAVRYGYSAVEVWGASPHLHPEDMTYREIVNLRHEIERRSLGITCYTPEQCVYPINLASAIPDERRRSLKFFEEHVRVAEELGADRMLVTSGWGYFDSSQGDDAWRYAADGITEIAECGDAHGIKIALEVLRKDESDLVNDLASLRRMMTDCGHDNLYAILDTCPMSLNGESAADYIEALGERLIHVHFIDGMPGGHLAWGDGRLPAGQYLKELEDGGYKGALSLEITDHRYVTDPSDSVKRSAEYLGRLMG